jgi:hypothetical protein
MHGMNSIKFINAKQAKGIYQYKNVWIDLQDNVIFENNRVHFVGLNIVYLIVDNAGYEQYKK